MSSLQSGIRDRRQWTVLYDIHAIPCKYYPRNNKKIKQKPPNASAVISIQTKPIGWLLTNPHVPCLWYSEENQPTLGGSVEQPRRLPTPTLQLLTDPESFGTIVDKGLFEPGMLQSLLGRDTLLGIVNKDSLQEVQEQPVEGSIGRDEFLQILAKHPKQGSKKHTVSCFIALTYFREARVVSLLG